ncbi:MAG: homoserine dehydrogenase, partial [Caulobacteraceae bacterium]|nr:homoserine dehydrogenase [Caulobacter sp.]
MSRTWRLGVAGLGTVGAELVRLVGERSDFAPSGERIEVAGVSARRREPMREGGARWFDDPAELAASPDIDVFVELIGGAEGPARDAVEAALQSGKPVVTANKALIATHGARLAALAEANDAALLFEAAVMGGAPAVKLVREAVVGCRTLRIAGILNGTCNYILSEMESSGRDFPEVLAEAQALGYAEADPTTDVGGFDAAHKIAILAALAFDAAPNLAGVEVAGIEAVQLLDIRLAHALGYRIKLIAEAARDAGGQGASVRVAPALVPLSHPLAQAGGALNALFVEGERTGRLFLQGAGAGAGPTAAAVAADIADVVGAARRPVFQRPAAGLQPLPAAAASRRRGEAYMRLMVRDRPGVLAAVTEALAEAGVSIDSLLQRPVEPHGLVPIVLTTQTAPEAAI